MFTATKEFNFEAGHCLDQHPGKCRNLHGHNYKVLVEISSEELNNMDMVKDFYDIAAFAKPLFEEFDHAFIYNNTAEDTFEHEIASVCLKHGRKVKVFPTRATAENMAMYFYIKLNESIPPCENYKITKVTVYETPTSFATYSEESNK